jgi:hypothetical protein
MTTRTPAQALAWADAHDTGYNGLCLKYVREAYNIGAKYATAHEAWTHAEHKHPGAALTGAPDGAIVHMHRPGEAAGHVGLLTGGRLRSTDSSLRHPHTTDLAYWTRLGYVIDGWAEDVNGVRVAGLKPKTTPAPAKPSTGKVTVLKLGSKGAKVKRLQQGLNAKFPAYSDLKVDSSYGPATEGVVREFQERAGLTVDGVAGPATQAALATYGVEL